MKSKIVIIGYSGHSFGCIETLQTYGHNIYGYCEPQEKKHNPYKINYLGNEENLNIHCIAFITIGDNLIRKNVFEKKFKDSVSFDHNIIHPSAIISKNSFLNIQNFVSAGAIINPYVKINTGCIINTGAIIEHECEIGSFSHIAPGAKICGNVIIGDNCLIGANSVINPGVKIGDNVTIGAGAVVLNDIKSNSTFVGNPAKKIY